MPGMPKRGRRKGAKGSTRRIQCDNCGAWIPEDKAIVVRRLYAPVEPQLARELERRGAIILRYPTVKRLCISCAVHYGYARRGRRSR